MIEVRQTREFRTWLGRLKDSDARDRIVMRLRRLSLGNPGDVKRVGGGVWEIRIDCGPGYGLYFTWRGDLAVVLLAGGGKSTQQRDIRRAQELARRPQEDEDEEAEDVRVGRCRLPRLGRGDRAVP